MKRAAVWVRLPLDEVSAKLTGLRPRVLVPTPEGVFVVGPNPPDEQSLAEVRSSVGGVGLKWTDDGIKTYGGAAYLDVTAASAVDLFDAAGLPEEAEILVRIDAGDVDKSVPVSSARRMPSKARVIIAPAVIFVAVLVLGVVSPRLLFPDPVAGSGVVIAMAAMAWTVLQGVRVTRPRRPVVVDLLGR